MTAVSHFSLQRLKKLERFDIKEKHKDFVAKLLKEMTCMGKGTTMVLVPKGYNFIKRRRVNFDKKVKLGKEIVEFLPRDKLHPVTIFKEATVDDKKYYLVNSSGSSDPIIVPHVYCSFDFSVKGIFRPLPVVDRRFSRTF